jgi:hypothetical protein
MTDYVFNGNDYIITAPLLSGGRPLMAEMQFVANSGYALRLNKKSKFMGAFINNIPVENTQNSRQQFSTFEGDMLVRLQGSETFGMD